jgi:hypothetical protein
MEQQLENFLNLVPGFKGDWTIKFFDKNDMSKQHSIFINPSDRTIIDMKIADVEVFNKIVSAFGKSEESVEVHEVKEGEVKEEGEEKAPEPPKNVSLKDKIDLHDFFDKIISEDKHVIVGFISGIVWRDESKVLHAPGSQVISYTIN